MGWIAWSKREDDILRKIYHQYTWEEIMSVLPGRTKQSISGRGRVLGLKRISHSDCMVAHDALIGLGNDLFATVDEEDYEWLTKLTWGAKNSHGRYYAISNIQNDSGISVTVLMHRLILNPPDHIMIDHINGDGLDNRKSNLRLCYAAQNLMNQQGGRGASSFKGVHPRAGKTGIRWQAYINFKGRQTHLGFFDTEEEAARAYDRTARNLFGEFANLNFK